ncbi:hypothetical protein AAES_33082 [Amazona aestiva]|uniref:FGAR-AT PurM N-terminal-like domain-containing protein n=1 Tax=Amazona aestiva TaxID=12930 RepID=A0A0Q3RVP3_AMAAE|nr:hypothetical protein AAES_33082 [Amazona aestiva]
MPLANVANVTLSHLNTMGAAMVLGEQPIKGLLDASAGAHLALTKALNNLVFARVTDLHVSGDGGDLGAVGDGGEMPPPPPAHGQWVAQKARTQLRHLRLHSAHCGHQDIVTQEPWSHHGHG